MFEFKIRLKDQGKDMSEITVKDISKITNKDGHRDINNVGGEVHSINRKTTETDVQPIVQEDHVLAGDCNMEVHESEAPTSSTTATLEIQTPHVLYHVDSSDAERSSAVDSVIVADKSALGHESEVLKDA